MTETVDLVPIDSIRADPDQPRKVKSPAQIEALAINFKQRGVGMINPIEVDKTGMIVTGEMRWLAAKAAGFAKVPVRGFTPENAALRYLRQVSENIHQASVNIMGQMATMDTARAFARLCEMEAKGDLGPQPDDGATPSAVGTRGRGKGGDIPLTGRTADQGQHSVARRLGIAPTTVSRYVGLLSEETRPEIRQALEEEKIGPAVAREVREAPKQHQGAFARRIVDEAQKGKVDSRSIFEVTKVLRRQPDNAAEVINVVAAGDSHMKTMGKLRTVAPTIVDAVDQAVAPGQELEARLEAAIVALQKVGSAGALPAGTQRSAYLAVTRLRDACDGFLSSSDAALAPIDVGGKIV